MSVKGFYLMPHPPIIIPEIGRGSEKEVSDTGESLNKVAAEIADLSPETIIIVSPHGPMFEDAIAIAYSKSIEGDLGSFGHDEIKMKLDIDVELADKIYELANKNGIPVVKASNDLLKNYNRSLILDHGAMVPLYFINSKYSDYKLIHITYAPLSDIELYKFGMLINQAVESLDRSTVFIASGDLSHKLKDSGPYKYSEFGEMFDKAFLENIKKGDALGLINIDEKIVSNAGECGRRSVLILLGALDTKVFEGKLLSYEGTFGVGYGVVSFEIKAESDSKLAKLEASRMEKFNDRLKDESPYVRLARESLTHYIEKGEAIKEYPDYITDEMRLKKRGVFVSIKKNGELRGCIGTILPTRKNMADEIIYNAIEAGIHDPRFYRISKDELLDIVFSVDILGEPEIAEKENLNPLKFGVIVMTEDKKGVLLPDLEGIDTVEEQLSVALRKAGISQDEVYEILRFEVKRYK